MLLSLLAAAAFSQAADGRLASSSAPAPVCSSEGRCTGQASADFSVGHGADGSSSPPASMEVASWSFGASNSGAASSSSMSAGRVSSPRDAASGLATGKRQHKPMSVSKVSVSDLSLTKRSAMCGSSDQCVSPSSVTLTMKGKDKGPRCTMGTHFPTVVITARGASAHLGDVTVAACDEASGTVSLNFSKIEWR